MLLLLYFVAAADRDDKAVKALLDASRDRSLCTVLTILQTNDSI